jgi:REP element-mobilizing transposase RayT
LDDAVDARLAMLVADKCRELGCRAVAVGNAADHVHALVMLAPTTSVASLAHRLKGSTSRILGMQLNQPFAWQAGYFAESVADVTAVARYVLAQREHHREISHVEGWELIARSPTPPDR